MSARTRRSLGAAAAVGLILAIGSCSPKGGGPHGLAPAIPRGFTATGGISEVTLSWTPVPGADRYTIYWDTSPGVVRATAASMTAAAPPHLHAGLTNGTTYHYIATASNRYGTSLDSIEASATPGDPTPVVIHDDPVGIGRSHDVAAAVDLTADGKILATGWADGAAGLDMVTWRFHPDGSFDTTFNGRGWVTHHDAAGGGGNDLGWDITSDAAGRIVVVGFSEGPTVAGDMVIWRFGPDGTLDTTFGGRGWVVDDSAGGPGGREEGMGVLIDPWGRILVGGRSDGSVVVWRFLADGTLDASLDGRGWVTHDAFGNGSSGGTAIARDSSGRIVVAGTATAGPISTAKPDLVVWRFLADGRLDATFDGRGWTTHDSAAGGGGRESAWGIALDAYERILVTGSSERATVAGYSEDMVVWRFQPDGRLDPGFAGRGWVVHDSAAGGGGDDRGEGIAVDPFGRIVVAGWSVNQNTAAASDMAIWRYRPDGTLDTVFTSAGAAGGGTSDVARDIVVDGTGRIVVAGLSYNAASDLDMVIWR